MEQPEQTISSLTPQQQKQSTDCDETEKPVNGDSSKESPPNGLNESSSSSSDGKLRLRRLLNRNMKITMTDGRTLIGMFLCTDRSCNVILGSCQEYLNYDLVEAQQKHQQQQQSESPPPTDGSEESASMPTPPPVEEPRVLGLAMVPGHHIVSIHVDDPIPDSGEEDEGGAIL